MSNARNLANLLGSGGAVTGNVTTTGTVEPAGDTAAGDNAAIGFTAAEGLILTGQGTTNDVTIKNDADADVIEIPTGTTNVTVAGTLGSGGLITSGAGITGAGLLTTGGNIVIPNAGTIGSAGDADSIAIASNGVVTFSQVPVFSGGGGGSVEKLSTVTTTGASVVDFNSSLITDTYMTYRIVGSNVRGITTNQTPQLVLSIDNGTSLDLNVRGVKFQQRLYASQSYNAVYYGTDDSVHQMGNNCSSTSTILSTFDVTVYNTRGAVGLKYVNSTFTGEINGDGDSYRWITPSRINTTTAINFLRLKFSSGNIAGTFTLYGIRA